MLNKFKLLKKDESGQVLVIFAFLLVVLLGFAALVIDVGYMAYQKSYLQTAADSAALAGAMEITKSKDDSKLIEKVEKVVKNFAKQNNLDSTKLLIIIPKIDITEGTVEVDITQEVPKFFAGLITSDKYTMTVHAKAKYSMEWAGEALPFLNVNNDYEKVSALTVWDKVSSGFFECIDDSDYTIKGTTPNRFCEVKYLDGLTIKNGTVAKKKDLIEEIWVRSAYKTVYILSLSSAVMDSGFVEFNDGTKCEIDKINTNNKNDVKANQLVLLECTFDEYIDKGKDSKTLYLTYNKVYDIGNNEFPPDYVSPEGGSSKLIE